MSESIKFGQIDEISDPQLRRLAKRVVMEVELAAAKCVAHKRSPAEFPMPGSSRSFEAVLFSRFEKLRPHQQEFAVSRLMPRLEASAMTRKKSFNELSGIDLRSATPIADQAEGIPPPAGLDFAQSFLVQKAGGATVATGPNSMQAQQTTNKLELRIHRVVCVDETGRDFNPLGDEPGSDEISLGGSEVDETGEVRKISSFKVKDFDDGDVKVYSPPKQFTFFNLSEGKNFPKSYFVTLVLAESDPGGGLTDFIHKLFDLVKERVTKLLLALGVKIGASGGLIGAAIGAAVGWAVGKVIEFLKGVWADDIFSPKTATIEVPSLSHRFAGRTDSPESSIRFTGHNGTYDLFYDWRLFA